MTELSFCPTWGIPWPNFCPIDGARLSGPWSRRNAPKPVARPVQSEAAPPPVAESPAPREAQPRPSAAPPRRTSPPIQRQAVAAPAARAAAPRAPEPVEPERLRRSVGQEVLETPKSLKVADPETGAVVVDEQASLVDESIPEEERRKFTLRKPEEE